MTGIRVQELSSATLTASLLTGVGIDEVYSRTEAGVPHYFLPDALGSTVALTDSAGQFQTEYTPLAYGL